MNLFASAFGVPEALTDPLFVDPDVIAHAVHRAQTTHEFWHDRPAEPIISSWARPRAGEIRRHHGVGRLVACVSDPVTFACGRPGIQIALVDTEAVLASSADLIVEVPEVAPYTMVLRLLTTCAIADLDASVYGVLAPEVVAAHFRPTHTPPTPHRWGIPLMGPSDPRWAYHESEARVAQSAGALACAFEACDHRE